MTDTKVLEKCDLSEFLLDESQLDLVAAFRVVGRSVSEDLAIPVRSILAGLAAVPATVAVVVFVPDQMSGSFPFSSLVSSVIKRGVKAIARQVAATQAVKRIEAGLVTESVDRSKLVSLRGPMIVDRHALEKALAAVDERTEISPAALVSMTGESVSLVEDR